MKKSSTKALKSGRWVGWLLLLSLLQTGCAPTLPPLPERRAEAEEPPTIATSSPEIRYDRHLCAVIGQHWLSLLEQTKGAHAHDTVMVSFVIHDTGQVSELQVAEPPTSEVAPLLCLRAVQDPAPYPPWPVEMRKQYGSKRALLFSFQFDAQERGYLAYWDQSELASAGRDATVFVPGDGALSTSTNRPWRLATLPVSIPKEKPRQVWGPGFYNYDLFSRPEPLMPPVRSVPVVIPPPNTGPGPKGR